jgi:hypothetical protein
MRILYALPLLAVAACGVENDPQNDQITLEYNEEQIENTAADVGNTAEAVVSDVGNTVEDVGNRVDVDVDVNTADNDGGSEGVGGQPNTNSN